MIKAIKITPLNTTKHTYSECKNCGFKANIYWENRIINTDSQIDMENILYEPCPKCGKTLGSKEDFLLILKDKIALASRLIEHLLGVQVMNKGLLMEYREVFSDFLKNQDIDSLKKLNEIFFRASPEGSETDFTTITSVNFEGSYISLNELIIDIQKLIACIENL